MILRNTMFSCMIGLGIALISCKSETKTDTAVVEEQRGINRAYMDTTMRPGDDFFRYVNGAWVDSTTIPEDRSSWGGFQELRKSTDADVLKIVESSVEDINSVEDPEAKKALVLYKAIMDTVKRNEQGIQPLQPYLEELDKINSVQDLQAFIENSQKKGGSSYLFGMGIFADSKDSNKNAVYINPPGLGLPDRDYYVADDEDSKKRREEYKEHVARMLQYLGDSEEEAAKEAQTILDFETKLAESMLDKVERRDPRKRYNPKTLPELNKLTSNVKWNPYFEAIGVKKLDTVIVSQPKYMKTIQGQITEANLPKIKSFIRWSMLNRSAPLLSTELEKADWDFYSKTLRGSKKQRPREERALAFVNGRIGEALGKLYVSEKFPPEAKQKAKDMIENIIKAYEHRIDGLAWMSDSTKTKAKQKLGTLQIKIGYPDKWKDYSSLEIADAEDTSLLEHARAVSQWNYEQNLEDLYEPVDKTEWFMSPQTVNAYYNPSYNEIVFPAAILQPPFYDYKADAAVNYGGIGAVIGHEISHGFDDSGAKYDKDGNLVNWWTEKDYSEFENLGTKLADQYSEIEVLPGAHINGKFTLGENIGDLGGVNAAYDGLQLYFEENGKPEPIDGLTPEQRFFMSWATVWRTKSREEALQNQLKTDPHSPGMYRAYVPLTNLDAFYEAFDIKEGDKLYVKPEDRVRIW